ncbi:MAG: hypothetical protein NVS3B21_35860 [Acidimicrobiales bacterium]
MAIPPDLPEDPFGDSSELFDSIRDDAVLGREVDVTVLAGRLGVVLRSSVDDATGWRWRGTWRGIEIAAWNDMDGVAVVADVGPWDEWVGLQGHAPDPSADEAMQWTIDVLAPWLLEPANAERIAQRVAARAIGGDPSTN